MYLETITPYEYCLQNKIKVIGLDSNSKVENEFYNKQMELNDAQQFVSSLQLSKNISTEFGIHIKSELYLELRMYTLVPYNILGIQKGIQHEHSVTQYLLDYVIDNITPYERAKRWARTHKTSMLLNGGTSNEGNVVRHIEGDILYLGTMQKAREFLKTIDIKFSEFYEPDLNSMLTGISFILDERVFNKKVYPDFKVLKKDEFLADRFFYDGDNINDMYEEYYSDEYRKYLENIGGETNHELRKFINQYRLA